MRVIDDKGEQLGIMTTQEAMNRADEAGLQLVEVNPKTVPPVCKIMDYGKFKYETAKRDREAKKHQKTTELKEVKFRPKTHDHDFGFKTRHIRRFVEEGDKVKLVVQFRGREITHPEKAQEQLDWITKQADDLANIEVRPTMEQRTMTLLMAPKPAVMQKVAQARAAAEKARQKAIAEGRAATHEPEDDEIEKLEQELAEKDGDDDDDDDEAAS